MGRNLAINGLTLWFQLEDTVLLMGTLLLFDLVLFPKYEAWLLPINTKFWSTSRGTFDKNNLAPIAQTFVGVSSNWIVTFSMSWGMTINLNMSSYWHQRVENLCNFGRPVQPFSIFKRVQLLTKNIETGIFRLFRFGNFTGFTPSDKYWTKVRTSQMICCECFCCKLKGYIYRRWDCVQMKIFHIPISFLWDTVIHLFIWVIHCSIWVIVIQIKESHLFVGIFAMFVQFSWKVFLLN